jgi:hypothetical protein
LFPFVQSLNVLKERSYDVGVHRDRVIDDNCGSCQFGRFETLGCGFHRDRNNAGNRGEIWKSREAVKVESEMTESAFDVVVEWVANDAALIESNVVWRYIGVPCALGATMP